jgi:hypothetical protein
VGCWILQTSGEIKAEFISILIILGGIVVVGSRSMRVIDHVLEFTISKVWAWRMF